MVSGGGTAGHVYPGLALLKALSRGESATEVEYVGSAGGLEAAIIADAGYPFVDLDVSGFPRRPSISGLKSLVKMVGAFRKAKCLLEQFAPDVVVGTGAYVSVPVVLAAASKGIPTVIHEQNALPGLANRLLGRFATAVAITYPETGGYFPRRKRVELTGNPVREDIFKETRDEARKRLGLAVSGKVLLIFGGSRGARRINDAAIGAAEQLVKLGVQVIHSTGKDDFERVEEAVGRSEEGIYRVMPYIDDMGTAYAAADLVLSRAGATTVAEITGRGIPSILVPYPYATGKHQEKNARSLEQAGAAVVITDSDMSSERLVGAVREAILDPARLEKMGETARKSGRPDAAELLASLVRETASVRKTSNI